MRCGSWAQLEVAHGSPPQAWQLGPHVPSVVVSMHSLWLGQQKRPLVQSEDESHWSPQQPSPSALALVDLVFGATGTAEAWAAVLGTTVSALEEHRSDSVMVPFKTQIGKYLVKSPPHTVFSAIDMHPSSPRLKSNSETSPPTWTIAFTPTSPTRGMSRDKPGMGMSSLTPALKFPTR